MKKLEVITKKEAVENGWSSTRRKEAKIPIVTNKILSFEGKIGSDVVDKVFEHIIDHKTNKVYEKRIK